MIDIKYASLRDSLFLTGHNLGLKLDVSNKAGLKLQYNREEKELYVFFNGHMALINDFISITPINPADFGVTAPGPTKTAPAPKVPQGKVKAQVSDPTRDVVFGKGD